MTNKTTIEWTEYSLNYATGCTRVSPGCDNCYMMAQYPRLHGMSVPGYEADAETVTIIPCRLDAISRVGEAHRRSGRPTRMFINSMSDTFHKDVPHEFNLAAFQIMAVYPEITFQILTKRPGRMAWFAENTLRGDWPPNIWAGTSVESQKYAPRLDVLRRVPALVRFVSAEPLLGPVVMDLEGIHWVIVGGESGSKARPMNPDWPRSIRDQCEAADVAFFFKQWGAWMGVDDVSTKGDILKVWRAASGKQLTRDEYFADRTPNWMDEKHGAVKMRSKKKAGALLDGREWKDFPKER